jgi:septum formation protein
MFPLTRPLVLASQSPRRKQILAMLGFSCAVHPSGIEEVVPAGMALAEAPGFLAGLKAEDVSRKMPEVLALGADTVVVLDGRMLGKPSDAEEALEMLRFLRGRKHRVHTGVALASGGRLLSAKVETSEVEFAVWPDSDLEAYVRGGEPMDKAGAYAIQGQGAFLVQGIQGCFFNVLGLPAQSTLQLLLPFRAV